MPKSSLTQDQLYQQLDALSEPRKDAAKRNVVEVHKHTVKDAEGNEKATSTRQRHRRTSEPPYLKLYLADMAKIYGCQPHVFVALGRRMEFGTNLVAITPRIREAIAKECGMKNPNSVKNALSKLQAAGLIKKVGGSEWMISPNILAKGDWEKTMVARELYTQIRYTQTEDGEVRREIEGAHIVLGKDKDADRQVFEEFREECKINENGYFEI